MRVASLREGLVAMFPAPGSSRAPLAPFLPFNRPCQEVGSGVSFEATHLFLVASYEEGERTTWEMLFDRSHTGTAQELYL